VLEREEEFGPNLRSIREVIGYHVHGFDEDVGSVEDLATDAEWKIQLIVIDTGRWLSGALVAIAPSHVQKVRWADRAVHIDLRKEDLKKSPEFNPSAPVGSQLEVRWTDFRGRPLKV
jgi:hypothetical protein